LDQPLLDPILPISWSTLAALETWIGVGSLDVWSPPSQHREIAGLIPNAHVTIFEGSGHMAPLEASQVVTQFLARWIAS